MSGLGRRSDLENEFNPIEEKLVEVIASSDARGTRFADVVMLAEKAGISRATVARYLSELVKRGVVKKDGVYKLAMEAIHWKHAQRSLFSVLSMHIFNDIVDAASQRKLEDEEFTRLFTGKIGALAMYIFLLGLSKKDRDPEEAGKWIEETFGTLPQKYGWRVCLNRQIFGGPTSLRHPMELERLPVPEIIVEEEAIYVKLPSTVEPGLATRVLKELPPIPVNKITALKESLKKLYPKEVELMDNTLYEIREAAKASGNGR
jgi:DNA-binding transcriptional regulator YhcF (GntR family)